MPSRDLAAVFLLLSVPVLAADKPAPPAGAYYDSILSVHGLMGQAFPLARGWGEGAKLYSIIGSAPPIRGDPVSENWVFMFGLPARRSGVCELVFSDGSLTRRKTVTGDQLLEEYFNDGEPSRRPREQAGWPVQERDYSDCGPIAGVFLDTPRVDAAASRHKLGSDRRGQRHYVLFRPMTRGCSGLDNPSLVSSVFNPLAPYPLKVLGRSVWAVHNCREALFFDAVSGTLLSRQPVTAKPDYCYNK